MTCVQTAAMFDQLAAVVGRAATPDDVEPVTWAIIERGRATSGMEHATAVERLRVLGREVVGDLSLRHLPDADADPPAAPHGLLRHGDDGHRRLQRLVDGRDVRLPFNFSGQPAISLPLAWTSDAIPIGVQLVGRYGDEATVLAVSRQLEQAMPWRDRRPAISA